MLKVEPLHLYHLVYFSKRLSQSSAELDQIIETSRRNNAALGITGALFVDGGLYFQVLEGPRDALSELLARIMEDERHEDVVLTMFSDLSERMFGDWNMAELTTADPEVSRLFDHYTGDVPDPTMLPGTVIWDMIESMANAVLGPRPMENHA